MDQGRRRYRQRRFHIACNVHQRHLRADALIMAIAGFKLRINGGGLVNVIVDVGYTFSHDFTGLLESTAYSVEFADYDTDGTLSDWSPALSATTPACPGPS